MSSPDIVTDDRVAKFVGDRCETIIYPPFTAIGLEKDGRIVAGAVFNSFTDFDIEVTVAGECGAFTRRYIRSIGQYVFGQLGCLRLSITTQQPHVINIARRLGAQTEGCKRDHFGKGRNAMMLGLLREDWKIR